MTGPACRMTTCPTCQRAVRFGALRLYDYRDQWSCIFCEPGSEDGTLPWRYVNVPVMSVSA